MISQKQFVNHYNNYYNKEAIYLWGANGETITKTLTDKLYNTFGSSTYNKSYYDNKFISGNGKIGADCSGSIFPLSKSDATARGYYNACKRKGNINSIPKATACLVFNAAFTHVGAYLGNGTTIEMMSSTRNCVKQTLRPSRWAYYGIPEWLDVIDSPIANTPVESQNKSVIANIQEWCNNYAGVTQTVDGIYGPTTKKNIIKALQHCLNTNYNAGINVDGSFGPTSKLKCPVASSCKELSYICQSMLYIKGYDMSHSMKNNNLDMSYGSGTKQAVLEYQRNTRGLRQDGECGSATFYAMFNS